VIKLSQHQQNGYILFGIVCSFSAFVDLVQCYVNDIPLKHFHIVQQDIIEGHFNSCMLQKTTKKHKPSNIRNAYTESHFVCLRNIVAFFLKMSNIFT